MDNFKYKIGQTVIVSNPDRESLKNGYKKGMVLRITDRDEGFTQRIYKMEQNPLYPCTLRISVLHETEISSANLSNNDIYHLNDDLFINEKTEQLKKLDETLDEILESDVPW